MSLRPMNGDTDSLNTDMHLGYTARFSGGVRAVDRSVSATSSCLGAAVASHHMCDDEYDDAKKADATRLRDNLGRSADGRQSLTIHPYRATGIRGGGRTPA